MSRALTISQKKYQKIFEIDFDYFFLIRTNLLRWDLEKEHL